MCSDYLCESVILRTKHFTMSLESRYHIIRSIQTLIDYVMYELFLCHISCKNSDSTS